MSGILAYKSEHYARNMVLSTYLIRKDFKLVLKLEEGHNGIMAFNISTLMTQDRKEPRSGDQSRSKIIQKGRNKVGNFQKEKPSMDPCLRKSLCWWKVATPTQSAESPLGVKTYCNPTTTMHLNSSWSSKVLAIVSLLLHEGLPDHCSNLLNQKHFSVSPTASFCNHFLKRTSKAYCDSSKYGKSLQSSPTLRDPMDCSPPGSSGHGILQARILEWVAFFFSRGSFQPRDQTCVPFVSCIGRHVLYHYHHMQIAIRSMNSCYIWVLTPTSPHTGCVTLSNYFYFFGSQVPHLQNERNNSTCLIELLWVLSDLSREKEPCQAHNKYSVNAGCC